MARDGNLRSIFRSKITEAMWTSVETGLTEAGVPDAHYLFPGGTSGWVEDKATQKNYVKIKPAQVAWLSRYSRLGGRCFLAVRYQNDHLLIYPGSAAAALHSGGLRFAEPLGRWSGGPARWDWTAIRALLTSSPPP